MSSLKVSKLSFVKAQLYGLVLQMLLFIKVASNRWYFLLLLGYFFRPLLSTLLQVVSTISNNTFTEVDFCTPFYTTACDYVNNC